MERAGSPWCSWALTRETATRTERQEGVGPSLPVVVFGQRVNPWKASCVSGAA
jgi:hypothetical protein